MDSKHKNAIQYNLRSFKPFTGELAMDRLEERTGASKLFALASWILSIPRISQVDALAVLQGLGENSRVLYAISIWENRTGMKNLLIAGQSSTERSFQRLTTKRLQQSPFDLKKTHGVIIQEEARNTQEQALWLSNQIVDLGLHSCALCAPPYHIVRAYLTVIKALSSPVILIPEPVPLTPHSLVPEVMIEADDMIAGECSRIEKYQATGYIATLAELKKYLDWLWRQTELQQHCVTAD
jgi:hypothetical protein